MTIPELREKVAAIDSEIASLKEKRREAQLEQKDAIQASFEAEHMVKVGDPIQTLHDGKMFYDGFVLNSFGNIICVCHPAKNDGTASKAIRHMQLSDFS